MSPRARSLFRVLTWPFRFGLGGTIRRTAILGAILRGDYRFDQAYYQFAYPEGPSAGQTVGIHPAVRFAETGRDLGHLAYHQDRAARTDRAAVPAHGLGRLLQLLSQSGDVVTAAVSRPADRGHRISVITPTFNRRVSVEIAIRSALDQEFPPFEILVCDDGSHDATLPDLKAVFADQIAIQKIRLFRTARRGAAAARNLLLQQSRGDLIAYLDSDVTWSVDHLSLASALFARAPEATQMFLSASPRPDDAPPTFALERNWLLQRNFVDLNTYLHRRSLYERWGGFDEGLSRLIDHDLVLRYGRRSHLFRVARDTTRYALSPDSITSTQPLQPAMQRVRRNHRLERVARGLDTRPIAVTGATDERRKEAASLRKLGYRVTEAAAIDDCDCCSLIYVPAPDKGDMASLANPAMASDTVVVFPSSPGVVDRVVAAARAAYPALGRLEDLAVVGASSDQRRLLREVGIAAANIYETEDDR